MTTCPKCGSCNISGPTYQRARGYAPDGLRYACVACGYSRVKPCNDARKEAGKRAILAELDVRTREAERSES